MQPHHVSRPGGVTLLMVLGVINGIIGIGAGLFLMLDNNDAELQELTNMTSSQLSGAGIGNIVVGAILLVAALALGGGSSLIRWVYGIITMFSVAFGIWGLFALHGEQQLTAAFTTAFSLIILWILFGSERTDQFFAQN